MQRGAAECVSVGEAPGWERGSSAPRAGGCLPHGRDAARSLNPSAPIGQELRAPSQQQGGSRGSSSSASHAWDELVAEEVLAEPGTPLLASAPLWAAAGPATKARLKGRHHGAPLSRAHTSAESREEPAEPVVPDLLPRPGCHRHLVPSASATPAGDSLGGQQQEATLSHFPTSWGVPQHCQQTGAGASPAGKRGSNHRIQSDSEWKAP